MKYILTNGNRYFCMKEDSKQYMSDDKSNAYRFKTENKARNVIGTLPKAFKIPRMYVEEVYEDSIQEIGVNTNELDYEYIENIDMLAFLKDIYLFFTQISLYKPVLEKRIKDYENSLLDIEHAIEFQKMDAITSCKMIKQIKEIRNNRRIAKDKLMIIEEVLKAPLGSFCDGTLCNHVIDKTTDRMYIPRNLNELFVEMPKCEK